MIDQEKFEDARAELIANLTEEIELLLERKNISRKELAEEIGKTPGYVSQLLSGSRNMTLATFADICLGMSMRPADVLRKYVASSDAIHRGQTHVPYEAVNSEKWHMMGAKASDSSCTKEHGGEFNQGWHETTRKDIDELAVG